MNAIAMLGLADRRPRRNRRLLTLREVMQHRVSEPGRAVPAFRAETARLGVLCDASLLRRSIGFSATATILAVAAWLAMAVQASACDTPVYRYAMYRWTPLPYEVYCLHHGKLPKADQDLHKALAEEGPGGSVANVDVTPVDLDQKKARDMVPEPVKAIWKAQAGKSPARYVVMAPWGAELLVGDLDLSAARALVDSPARSEIGRLFDEGHGVVLVIVGGKEPQENARVEAACRAVMAKAEAGRLLVEPAPGSTPPQRPEETGIQGGPDSQQLPLRIGLVKLDRANAAERWLLKMLMGMAPDLDKSVHEPMLYAIYGRGRVMPPGIGREVNAESLTELLRFLAEGCSCTVKDQNPGLDLLMRWDWDSTAERFAAEERAGVQPPLYAEVSAGPEAAMPPAAEVSPPGSVVPGAAPPGKIADAESSPPAAPAGSAKPKAASARVAGPNRSVAGTGPGQTTSAASAAEEASEAGGLARSFAARQRWQLGLGLVGAAAFVLAAGVVLLRRRNHDSP